ncbi:CBS domain-containing protein [Prauserella cavernicola]|uniref:CBS domain-containing protein n=1 Tax=Prauserella cavernicola TaxID=2800127 RepID=A0A934QSF4_9PSEU|nr:CBS domain-containing protein [Prauserella cavernicola]MBK1787387.1 CBS domain-containing protein [Prauserella cavernicola]
MLAREVMSAPVVTVTPDTPVRTAAALLADRGFTALPVVDDDGWLLGVVTEADLVRGRFRQDIRSPHDGEVAEPSAGSTTGEVMTAPAVAVSVLLDVVEIVRVMLDEGLRSVPVVDGERVVGIVSRRDLVRMLARDDERLARDVRNRLAMVGTPDRWSVRVADGVVTITDPRDDEADRHVATVLAESVPGVLRVRCVHDPA